jgi:protein-disulfide isomerase
MRIYHFIKPAIFIICACVFSVVPILWAQNQSSPEKPQELDETKLKEKILSRMQKADAGKHETYNHLGTNLVIVEKKIPFQVLNQTLFGVRLKILPVLPNQKHEFLNLVVDPTLAVQYPDILDMETGASLFHQVMTELRRITLPEKSMGSEIYKGSGSHQIVLISDPFCPYCRQVWAYLVDHKDKIKSLKMVHYPIQSASETACAVLEFARQKRLNIFDIIHFSYTRLNSSDSPSEMLEQYAAEFPLLKKYWGNDLDAAANKLQNEYLPAIHKEQSEAKDLGIVGTPVTFVGGYMIEGGNFPKFDELLP